jgi:hypothetical protein
VEKRLTFWIEDGYQRNVDQVFDFIKTIEDNSQKTQNPITLGSPINYRELKQRTVLRGQKFMCEAEEYFIDHLEEILKALSSRGVRYEVG